MNSRLRKSLACTSLIAFCTGTSFGQDDPLAEGAIARLGSSAFRYPHALSGITYSGDGKLLAAAGDGDDPYVHVWDSSSGRQLFTVPHRSTVVAFSSDSRVLAISNGSQILFFDASSGKPLEGSLQHVHPIVSIAFSPEGALLAAAEYPPTSTKRATTRSERPATLYVWSWKSGKLRWSQTAAARALQFSPDGTRLWFATGGFVNAVNAESGDRLVSIRVSQHGVEWFDITRDGKWGISCGLNDEKIELWTARSGGLVRELPLPEGPRVRGVRMVRFSPNQAFIAAGEHGGTAIHVFETRTWRHFLTLGSGPWVSPQFTFSPDGKLTSAGVHRKVRIWTLPEGQELFTAGQLDAVSALAFSPDANTLASGDYESVRFWNTRSGKQVTAWDRIPQTVTAIAYSADSSMIALGLESEIKVLKANSGEQLLRGAEYHRGCPLTFVTQREKVPGFERAAAIQRWPVGEDLDVAMPCPTWWDPRRWNADWYSPNGRWIARPAPPQGSIVLIDAESREVKSWLQGHTGLVVAWGFSSDSRRLFSVGVDKTVRLWNVESGDELLRVDSGTGAAFSQDGTLLATSMLDTTILIWDLKRIPRH